MEFNIVIDHLGRRSLKTRTQSWVIYVASKVSSFNITPNQISVLSIFLAIIASYCLLEINSVYKWLLAIIFIQLRLFCNLLDGLVAIEGGKRSKLGEMYNDLPDRISDVLIIIAFGYAIPSHPSDPSVIIYSISNFQITSYFMGLVAAILAVFTAYIRVLFTSLGAPANYCGPMAKQHRMALLTFSCLMQFFIQNNNIIIITLILLNLGLIITIYRRIYFGTQYLLCH